MKKNLFLVLLFCFSCFVYSQELATDDEYEIYGILIGEQGFQFYPIDFEILGHLEFTTIDDAIFREIEKMQSKSIDQRKLFGIALKYSINRTFRVIEGREHNQIYLSPIYFKTKDEAYFIGMIKTNMKKPIQFFYQAKRINNKWEIDDYYEIY